jgi:hypothetical protein
MLATQPNYPAAAATAALSHIERQRRGVAGAQRSLAMSNDKEAKYEIN